MKGRRRSKKVERLIKGYMTQRKKGLSNKQIAAFYGVSEATLYNYLSEIAEKHGVSRESLYSKSSKQEIQSEISQEQMNLKDCFEVALKQIKTIIQQIDVVTNE